MCARIKQPFEYTNQKDFHEKLVEWIGDVLYEVLPDNGFEIRDEQIFTAFQIADAFGKHKIHFAEAGLGTGKTFAYLLSAIPYARLKNKPVVIACASTALQEQLASETGDIMKLSKVLGLNVDIRMAKDPHQYICDAKVNENKNFITGEIPEFNDWLGKTTRGERSELPMVSDKVWKRVGWDESMSCDSCLERGYCKLMKAKEYYRETSDIIVVDHETFFADLWTREELLFEGKIPILPDYAAIVFDEGHRVFLPAVLKAGHSISQDEMQEMADTIEEIQGARDSFIIATLKMNKVCERFFYIIGKSIVQQASTNRRSVRISEQLLQTASDFKTTLDDLLVELQIEQGLYTESLTSTQVQAFEGQIERASKALHRLLIGKGRTSIIWYDELDDSFVVVPREIYALLQKHLYKKDIPVIFTSATLSNEGDFSYIASSLGVSEPSVSTIGSPFNMEEQVKIFFAYEQGRSYDDKIQTLVRYLNENNGHSLVLANSLEEVKKIRQSLSQYDFPFEILWEDKADRGYLIRRFKEEESSVLIGADLWEGIDIPGEALTMVIVWQLPFPLLDPIIQMQRIDAKKKGEEPNKAVDFPLMGLTLKQGCGRLIRTETDHGKIIIMDRVKQTPWESYVMGALPEGAIIKKE